MATKTNSPMLGLRTCIYKVVDLDSAKKWYSNAFQIEPYFDEPFYVGFNIAGYELGLLPEEKFIENKTRNVITYWGVNDIHSEFNRFLELEATVDEEPNNVGGELMVASVVDPWGNVIGLIYNPYFKLDNN